MPLPNRFCRLFDLVDNQQVTIVEMFALGWVRKVRLGNGDEGC